MLMYLMWLYLIVPGEIFQKNVEKLLQSFNKSENIINNNRSPEFETNYQIKRSKKHFYNRYINHSYIFIDFLKVLFAFYTSIHFQILIFQYLSIH